ncbi:DUF5641 domain-containing protein [Trichonephila clavata]|uniref:DUF5641 domain-containing protein n=1 Tax=Trichonephila clavata TaxID=2740835 RepID=A0A8X6EZM7_TRICU|nr:DUF5641 domain-containing protein [Trichonephila clavata]
MQDYTDKKRVEAVLKDTQNEVNILCWKPRDTAYIALFTWATTHEESLSTVLIGIEAALNSRPLIYEEESDDKSAALTPAHFLTGRKLTAIPNRLENTRLNKIYKQQQDLLDCFWKKWSKEYLLQLRSFHQVRNMDSTINIRVGDIVLLQEDIRPRQHVEESYSDEPTSGTRREDKILRAES